MAIRCSISIIASWRVKMAFPCLMWKWIFSIFNRIKYSFPVSILFYSFNLFVVVCGSIRKNLRLSKIYTHAQVHACTHTHTHTHTHIYMKACISFGGRTLLLREMVTPLRNRDVIHRGPAFDAWYMFLCR